LRRAVNSWSAAVTTAFFGWGAAQHQGALDEIRVEIEVRGHM
jgi:hypothetical protein